MADKMAKNNSLILLIGLLVVGALFLAAAYLYKRPASQLAIPNEQLVQQEVQRQLQAFQEEATRKAEEEVAQSANPFKAKNLLQGVEVNPLEKVKDELNPF